MSKSFSKASRFSGGAATAAASAPGPGAYNTRGNMGNFSSSYTMRARTSAWSKDQQSPGPGNYNPAKSFGSQGMKKSMSVGNIRGKLSSTSATPGPGAYEAVRLENATTNRPPSFSMRPRTSYMATGKKNTPGPGNYTISTHIGKGLSKSMSMRTLSKSAPSAAVPGPGAYAPVLAGANRSPAYTLRARTKHLGAVDESPGPGAYKLGTYVGRSTAKSMHKRTNIKTESLKTPGPGSYQESQWFGNKGLTVSMKGSRKVSGDESTPGPAAYNAGLSLTKQKSASYSMRQRTANGGGKAAVPGPIYNIKGSIGNSGKPAYTMRPRTTNASSKGNTPGPSVYSPSIGFKGKKQPSYTMRARTKSTKSVSTPGPKYDPRRQSRAPSYTMRGRNSYF